MNKGQLVLIKTAIDKGKMTKSLMLMEYKKGMIKEAKRLNGKGDIVTVEALIGGIRQESDFLEQMARIDIRIDDFEEIAEEILNPSNIEYFEKKIKIGRNERCPCGSGKKYKKCCGI